MKVLVILSAIVCCPIICLAQLKIHGLVNTDGGGPLAYASILLLERSDSSFVQGQFSDENGFYSFEVESEGDYFISISAVGYHKVFSHTFSLHSNNSPYDLEPITASDKTEELEEITVTAEAPMFEHKIDRTIINVQNIISGTGGSALDLLQRSPGVTVDKISNTISLSGKENIKIMINGRMSRLPYESVVQMLEGVNAENIEQIELITNPPAKYEAEGDGGIIHIVMKKQEDFGTNGTFSLKTGYGRRGKIGGTFNLNHRSERINVFGDMNTNNDFSRQYMNTDWKILAQDKIEETSSNNNRKPFTRIINGSLGFDWELGDKTSIGGLFSAFDRKWDMDAIASISKWEENRSTHNINMKSVEDNNWLQLLGSLQFIHQINEKYDFTIDLDRINYNSLNPTDYYQDFFNNGGDLLFSERLRSNKDTGIDIWTTALDFSGNINDYFSFEAGAKGSFTALDNIILVDNLINNIWNIHDDFSGNNDMIENVLAGYISAGIKASERTDIQAGIRFEHTKTNINEENQKSLIDRKLKNIFPSLFITHAINNTNFASFSYSRRISRPSFNQLAPFVIFNDPDNFFTGNISLMPSITDAVNLGYQFKTVFLSLQYSYDKNAISLFQPQINSANKHISSSQNMDYMQSFNLMVAFPIQIADWWTVRVNGMGRRAKVKASYLENATSFSKNIFSFNGIQNFKITKTITVEATGFYFSRQLSGIMESAPVAGVDFGIQKEFKNSHLRFSFSDIFRTIKYDNYISMANENLNSRTVLDFETSIASLTYTLNFGNEKIKDRKSMKSSSQEEQERLQE